MADTINGRTPEEIKKGLWCCMNIECPPDCPYFGNEAVDCNIALNTDAAVAISQLIRERDEARNDLDTINYANTELHSAYEAMKRERDAAVADMTELMQLAQFCRHCKHITEDGECTFDFAANKGEPWCWQWRCLQEVE